MVSSSSPGVRMISTPMIIFGCIGILVAMLLSPLSTPEDVVGPLGACPPTSNKKTPINDNALADLEQVNIPHTLKEDVIVTVNASLCRSFSESYAEARDKFRRASGGAGAELHTLDVIPEEDGAYTIDIAIIRGASESGGMVIHSSGVHGVEGYVGSAIQIAFLRHLAASKTKANSSSSNEFMPTIIFIHAVNPYGMAHFRRTDQNNVDLNRNALHPEQWIQVRNRQPNAAGYDDMAIFYNPSSPPTMFGAYITYWLRASYVLATKGFLTAKRAMVTGQYHCPSGISFGGMDLSPSHRLLWDFFSKSKANEKETMWNNDRGKVTLIDVHSGLGPSGVDTLMFSAKSISDGLKDFPNAHGEDMDGGTGGDAASGYDMATGYAMPFYGKLFANHALNDISMLVQEFGTVKSVLVGRSLILENAAMQHAPSSQPYWSMWTRDAFYIRTLRWRRSILRRGLTVLYQGIWRSSS